MTDTEPECTHESWEITSEWREGTTTVQSRRCADCKDYLPKLTTYTAPDTDRQEPLDLGPIRDRHAYYMAHRSSRPCPAHPAADDVPRLLIEILDLRNRMTVIAQLADALGDSLPGDNWALAHAIKQIATGELTTEEAIADFED